MPALMETFVALRHYTRDQQLACQANTKNLAWRLADVLFRTWDLGITSFGGPPVHFQRLHRRFVLGSGGQAPWVDEQTFQELFAICQGLPGPASTKMIVFLSMLHAGLTPAILSFFLWSLPGAIGMYGLSLGVRQMGDQLPGPVYALLSGLNAATVGVIALAAVQLSEKAIKDQVTRMLVIFGACAGICYSGLWYFPVLIAIGGLITPLWDCYLHQKVNRIKANYQRRKRDRHSAAEANADTTEPIPLREQTSSSGAVHRRPAATSRQAESSSHQTGSQNSNQTNPAVKETEPVLEPVMDTASHAIPLWYGLCIIAIFLATFIAVIVVRSTLPTRPLPFALFSNMYLAGTIIFGGGPVVIPLLRSYVVDPGWVSSRDFLIGLAIIQAFPGPNFNFAVYLGALAVRSQQPTVVGALISFFGIFTPGMVLAVGAQGLWSMLRAKAVVVSVLRGVNAVAVGLVFTAVYRLWGIGFLTPEASDGKSLAEEPWWVVVTAVTYAESAWFGVPAPAAILFGAVLGLGWYGVVR